MFGLYGDLPAARQDEAEAKPSGWATSATSLKPGPRRIVTNLAPPPSVRRAQPQQQGATTIRAAHSADAGAATQSGGGQAESAPIVVGASGSLSASVAEEYDPARPNSYEDVRRQRELKRKAAELEEKRKQLEERRKEAEARRRESEAATASASLDISGEEAYLRRAAMSGMAPDAAAQGDSAPAPSRPGGMSLAERMMKNMGWKEGQGLGKDGQGIATPLMMKKVGKGAGEIVAAQPLPGQPEKKQKTVSLNSPPTRVLLMKNMVGPGEVDEDLEEEVAKECEKYGPVVRCLIFEITDPACPAEEAVRIFVQFTKADSAMKALLEMDGRFFGGRVVGVSFYDEARFEANDLLAA